jgi:hypothetical protein
VGLAAGFLEEKGFSTIVLTPTPEFHGTVGIPRSAAIAYPYGRLLGRVGDTDGQREVLLAGLSVLEKAQQPGEVWHLPFTWPEDPKKTDWQPPEMSPIIKLFLKEIKEARRREEERRTRVA